MVEPTNEMKSLAAQLRAEENRIFFQMCRTIYSFREDITRSAKAIGELDVIKAKAKLGKLIGGVVPEVGNEGVIRCNGARHPVLILRGVNPKGNDINLDANSCSLVISGPNAGMSYLTKLTEMTCIRRRVHNAYSFLVCILEH